MVDDIARGTVAALKRLGLNGAPHRGYEIINLGSDRPMVLMDVIHIIEGLLGKKAVVQHRPRHPADILATWADISKARRLLGWRPQVPFTDGVRRAVEWYLGNRSWASKVGTRETTDRR